MLRISTKKIIDGVFCKHKSLFKYNYSLTFSKMNNFNNVSGNNLIKCRFFSDISNNKMDYDQFVENRDKVKTMRDEILGNIPTMSEAQVTQTIKIFNDYKIMDEQILSEIEKFWVQRTSRLKQKEIIK